MNSNIPILEIKKLRACVNDSEILKNLSLKINRGEIHAIMGPNGSGKSTFSKIIAGHPAYKISNGDILFNGKSILNKCMHDSFLIRFLQKMGEIGPKIRK